MAKKRSQTVQEKLNAAYARLAAMAVKRAVIAAEYDRFVDADKAMSWAAQWADRAGAKAVRWTM